jgi:excisionase family DNA binding protein
VELIARLADEDIERIAAAVVRQIQAAAVIPGPADRMLTAEEAAERLGVTPRHVWKLGRDGKLERFKAPGGQRVLFPESGVERYLAGGASLVEVGASAASRASRPGAPGKSPRRRF